MLPILAFFSACSNHKAGDEQKAYALFLEAINHNAAGDKKLAITLIDSALQMNAADTTRSWLTCEKTTALVDLGKLKEATAIGKNGILFAEKIKDEEGMMGMCGSLGICYRRLGDLDSSLFYYKKGLETAIESQNTEYEIYLNNCISVLFNEQKRYREAIEYSDKAENKATATNDTIERLSAHANKGAIFMRQGLYRKSIDFLTPLWGMVKEANYNVLTLKYLSPLLKSYLALGKTDSVMHYMAYADEACRNLGPTSNGILGILEIKAQMLGKQKRYAEQSILLDSISRFKKLSDIDKQLSEFNVKYKTLEKEVQIEKMNHEQSLLYIRILCLTIAIIILLIAILIILYRRKLDKQRAELTEKTSYINGVETERKRLAKELHDGVCNDILAVNIMMQTDKEAAERLLKNVGNDVRRLSHELIPPRFDNASLSELVCTYCQSMSAENGTIVKPFVSRSFEKLNLPSRTALEVYRIVQESVSNAIKYGYSKMITVTLDASNNQASLCIANDISPEHPITQGKMGIGKDTLKMRTEALKAILTISEQDEEYKVEVRFPL